MSRDRRIYTAFIVAGLSAIGAWFGLFRFAAFGCRPGPDKPPIYSTGVSGKFEGLIVTPSGRPDHVARATPVTAGELRITPVLSPHELWNGYAPDSGTSWTVRFLNRARLVGFARLDRGDEVHWGAFECRGIGDDAISTGCFTQILLHHVSTKNLRQQAALRMAQIGWGSAPSFVCDGLFWRGPRVLTWDGTRYVATPSTFLSFVALLQISWMFWGGILCVFLASLTVGARLPGPVVHDVTLNLSIVLWVAVALRLLVSILNDDFLYTLGWLSPLVACAVFCTVLFAFFAARRA